MMPLNTITRFISIPILVAGCAMGPDYQAPSFTEDALSTVIAQNDQNLRYGEDVDLAWWRGFGDPKLEALIIEAREANPDLREAVARLDQARAQAVGARVRFLPVTNAELSGQRLNGSRVAGAFGPPPIPGIPEEQSLYTAQLGASWEIDLFGRIRRRAEVAKANFEGSAWQRRGVLLSVTAQVGLQYATLVALNQQINVAEENRSAAKETLSLTERLWEAELGSEELLLLARADLNAARAAIAPLIAARHASAAQLAILLGRKPALAIPTLIGQATGPITLKPIPIGLSSDLLRRRPDVHIAERQLAAATAGIGAEVADLYPSFELTGGFGNQALSTNLLFDNAARVWSYGGFVRMPLFNLGEQKAEVDVAKARAAEALAAFDNTVLQALAETEEALVGYDATTTQLDHLSKAVADQKRAVELVSLRFSKGLASGIDVLDAKRRLFALRAEHAAVQGEAFRSLINANLALGGGWQTAPSTQREVSNADNNPN